MRRVWAETALTAEGWVDGVAVAFGEDGRIASVAAGPPAADDLRVGILLPAPANAHSHAFQRAMAGLTERRGQSETPGEFHPERDSFWSWRQLMYRFLRQLSPEDVEAIAALAQMESLEAGYGSIGEFHYLHHQPDGTPYDDPAEMGGRIAAAAAETGIGLTLLPVLYERAACDGRALGAGQRRFGCDPEGFARLWDRSAAALAGAAADARIGVAPHSLRAVSPEGLAAAVALSGPVHIHIAEQVAEVEEVAGAYGATPVAWLLDAHAVDARWCLIHATHMTPAETEGLARSGAVAGLCPVTEANLGDGIFDGVRYVSAGGAFAVGTDSNVRISLSEELRMLEYSQRLRDRGRAALSDGARSAGRLMMDAAVSGGAQALDRGTGGIAVGAWADLAALDGAAVDLQGREGDAILDGFVFATGDRAIREVWSAGRHVVRDGRHVRRDAIVARYGRVIQALRDRL